MLFELCTLASIRKLRSAQKPAKPHAMRFRKPRRRKTCHRTWVAKWISTLGTCCQKHTHDGQMILKWKTFGRRFKRGKELKQTKGFRTSRLASCCWLEDAMEASDSDSESEASGMDTKEPEDERETTAKTDEARRTRRK